MAKKRRNSSEFIEDEEKQRLAVLDSTISKRQKYFPFLATLDRELEEFNTRPNVSPTQFFAMISKFERSLISTIEVIRHNRKKNRILSNHLKYSILNIVMSGSLFGLWDHGASEYEFQCSLVILLKHYINAKLLSILNSKPCTPKKDASLIYMFVRSIFKGTRHHTSQEAVLDTFLCSNIFDIGGDNEKIGRQILHQIVKEPHRYFCIKSATVLIKFLTLVKVYMEESEVDDEEAVSLAETIRKYQRRVIMSELKDLDAANKLVKGFGNDGKKLYLKIKPMAIIAKVKSAIDIPNIEEEEEGWSVPSWVEQEEIGQIDTKRNYVVTFDDKMLEAMQIGSSDEEHHASRPSTPGQESEVIGHIGDEEDPISCPLIDEMEIDNEEESENDEDDEEYAEETDNDVDIGLQNTSSADVETDGRIAWMEFDSLKRDGGEDVAPPTHFINELLVNGTLGGQETSSGLVSSEIELTANGTVKMIIGQCLPPRKETLSSHWECDSVSGTIDSPRTNRRPDPRCDITFPLTNELEHLDNKCQVAYSDDDDIQIVGEFEGDADEEEDVDDVVGGDGERDEAEPDPREVAEHNASRPKLMQGFIRNLKRACQIEQGLRVEDLSPDETEEDD